MIFKPVINSDVCQQSSVAAPYLLEELIVILELPDCFEIQYFVEEQLKKNKQMLKDFNAFQSWAGLC